MKKVHTSLAAAVFYFAMSGVAYAQTYQSCPDGRRQSYNRISAYVTDAHRRDDRSFKFAAELQEEGKLLPLKTGENTCDAAGVCGRINIAMDPCISGLRVYRLVLKPDKAGQSVQVSKDIVIDHDAGREAGKQTFIVEPFRILTLEQQIFETAVNSRFFVIYPKNFTTQNINSNVVKLALAETYQTLRNIRKVDEFTAFLNLVSLYRDYNAIGKAELLSVIISEVNLSDPADVYAAEQILIEEGFDIVPTPPPPAY